MPGMPDYIAPEVGLPLAAVLLLLWWQWDRVAVAVDRFRRWNRGE